MDLIISVFPPSSEHLSLRAALTSDTHPSTLQFFSRSSFPSELSSFYVASCALNSKGHLASTFLLQPLLRPQGS